MKTNVLRSEGKEGKNGNEGQPQENAKNTKRRKRRVGKPEMFAAVIDRRYTDFLCGEVHFNSGCFRTGTKKTGRGEDVKRRGGEATTRIFRMRSVDVHAAAGRGRHSRAPKAIAYTRVTSDKYLQVVDFPDLAEGRVFYGIVRDQSKRRSQERTPRVQCHFCNSGELRPAEKRN